MTTPLNPSRRTAAEDAVLLDRIRRRDPGAFDAFVSAYGDRIFGFGLRMCREREDARDVVQETLIQAYRSLGDLTHPEALRSWVYRVAANACLMKRRRGKFDPLRELSLEELAPDPESGVGVEIPDPSSLPDEEAGRRQIQELVRAAVGDLPPHYRIIVVMRDMEQLSTEETARALGLPETTVKMRLHRGRLMVRKALETTLAGRAPRGRSS
jgi:RNA polymerase sigma-70 factor (ECF subfamily)